ncbi:hypothetical protein C8R47DRAFT_251355 [Mycena vitilis]|nr:hypothetical protein C8R47DRAFT_251355 [Mycena vitilis]
MACRFRRRKPLSRPFRIPYAKKLSESHRRDAWCLVLGAWARSNFLGSNPYLLRDYGYTGIIRSVWRPSLGLDSSIKLVLTSSSSKEPLLPATLLLPSVNSAVHASPAALCPSLASSARSAQKLERDEPRRSVGSQCFNTPGGLFKCASYVE